MILSDKAYDILKWVAQYLLPGLATLYFALSQIWGLPYGEQVIGTIAAVSTFLGVFMGISTATYKARLLAQQNTKSENENQLRLFP